jgi:hypothetical protein
LLDFVGECGVASFAPVGYRMRIVRARVRLMARGRTEPGVPGGGQGYSADCEIRATMNDRIQPGKGCPSRGVPARDRNTDRQAGCRNNRMTEILP